MGKRREVQLYHSGGTRWQMLEKVANVEDTGYGTGIFNSVDRLYREFVEYIAGKAPSQFTGENEDIEIAKDILRITDNVRFDTIRKGFKLVDKFSFEGEDIQCQKE